MVEVAAVKTEAVGEEEVVYAAFLDSLDVYDDAEMVAVAVKVDDVAVADDDAAAAADAVDVAVEMGYQV